MTLFLSFGGDLPSVALIVLHSLEGSVQCLHELSPCVSTMFVCYSVAGPSRWDLWI